MKPLFLIICDLEMMNKQENHETSKISIGRNSV